MATQLEHIVLEHIHTYGLTIPQALMNVFGLSEADANETLKRLCKEKLVRSALLTPHTEYFYLQPRAAEVLRVHSVDVKPLRGVAKIAAYAMLHFCCLEETYRPRIPKDVWQSRFKKLYRVGEKINYYTEGCKLGYVRIDSQALGVNPNKKVSSDPFRPIETCWNDILKRQQRQLKEQGTTVVLKEFSALIESGHFVITVVTAFEERAKRIRRRMEQMVEDYALHQLNLNLVSVGGVLKGERRKLYETFKRKQYPPRQPPPMEVHAIPDLFELMYPTANGPT